MRFYVTNENVDRVKESFLNVRSFFIINTKEISESFQFVKNEDYFNFLVNEEIKTKIIDAAEKKKYSNIIYVNENLNVEVIENIKDIIKSMQFIEKFIFIESGDNFSIYPLFDEVIFFPETKKVKIIECESIKNPLYYWLNNLNIPQKI
jgi:hypothetical protein